ncbi:uncharacterized protein LOC112084356 [Eutrema salsugineum]|uniref:uncharacterized protein LOC112084356 n=1 Tax=Eutrema salsugineum TaxID=72664 RepID=UPI000CED244E|nr:uncharacterized protein LOC112084356 [Eutrema salsugineum]
MDPQENQAEQKDQVNQAQVARNKQQALVNQNMAERNEHQAQMNQNQAARNEHQAHSQYSPEQTRNSKFHALPMEDPLDHLDNLDKVCNLTKINGISEDGFKLRLFPFSLGDKAHHWEKNLPRGSIQTWEQSSLLSTLYRRALPKIRNQLDTASNGNFLAKEINAAMELVENLAMRNDTYGEDYDRAYRGDGYSEEQRMRKDIKELQRKLDKRSYITLGIKTSSRGITTSTTRTSYINPNVANPGDQVYPSQQAQQSYVPKNQFQRNFQSKQQYIQQPQQYVQLPQQYVQKPQQNQGSNFNSQPPMTKFPPGFGQQRQQKGHQMGSDLSGVLQQILQGQQRLKDLQKNQASSSRTQGTLPGKPEPNPKEYAYTNTLRSGKELPERKQSHVLIEDNKQLGGEVPQGSVLDDEAVKKDKGKGVEKEMVPEKPYVPPPPYQPKLLFPRMFKKQLSEKARAVFEKQLKKTQFTMPNIESFLMRRTIPKNLSDPRSFTLPCTIGPLKFASCLCDLGASVSLMPFSIAKKLGFTVYKPARISLVLADRSVRLPIGLLEDLPLKIGDFEVRTNFIVLEVDEEPMDPLILGRPFLATAGAIIDVTFTKEPGKHGFLAEESEAYKMVLDQHRVAGSETQFLELETSSQMMKKPPIEEQVFYVETMDLLADELLEELTLEDPFQVILTKEPGKNGFLAEESEAYKMVLDQHRVAGSETQFLELETSSQVV